MEQIKETEHIEHSEHIEETEEKVNRANLNIQQFMNDMTLIGDQVNNKDLIKPAFHYGDLSVTNYLLWLLLGEMTILNDNLEEE